MNPTPVQSSSNTTVRIGDPFFLKVYRRLQKGVNPELEIGRYLTEVVHFPNIVPVAGALEHAAADGAATTLALLQAFVMNQGDGWDYTVNYLVRFLEDRRTGTPLPEDVHGLYLALIRTLARRTAELHCALATPTSDAAFAPEPITEHDVAHWYATARVQVQSTFELLKSHVTQLPASVAVEADLLMAHRAALLKRLEARPGLPPVGIKIRHHGDYHLGQVLVKRNDFVIVDFEGEPARPLEERRAKSSPLRDVAGMLRSFQYAMSAAQKRCATQSADDCAAWVPLLERWEAETRATFTAVYDEVARACGLYKSLEEVRPLLDLFEIDKALYEIRYELGNRPDWASIPIRSLLSFAR